MNWDVGGFKDPEYFDGNFAICYNLHRSGHIVEFAYKD